MIDPKQETLLTVAQAAECQGVTIHGVYNWIYRGAGGRKLEACLVRGIIHTSVEAIERFNAPLPLPAIKQPRTTRERQRASKQAEAELAARGA